MEVAVGEQLLADALLVAVAGDAAVGQHDGAAAIDDEVLVEISAVVDAIFNEIALLVLEPFGGPPAFCVDVQCHLDDLVGSQETIVDSLLQREGVERVANIL